MVLNNENEINLKLTQILSYVNNEIDFYKGKISQTLLAEKKGCEALLDVPVVDKAFIKAHHMSFISNDIKCNDIEQVFNINKNFKQEYSFLIQGKKIYAEYTSGTTGTPFAVIKTPKERLILGNYLWKIRRKIYPFFPNDFFYFTHNFSQNHSYDLSMKSLNGINTLNLEKYKAWHILPFQLSVLSSHVREDTIAFKNLKMIECNGAYISEEEKAEYANLFKCLVRNNYGCRECWNIAYDCEEGYLHVNDKTLWLEIIDDNGKRITEDEKIGNIVITSLVLKTMPIIRYQTGDYGSYIGGDCKCGLKSKRIRLLPGRNIIKGTTLYGNIVFRSVLMDLMLECDMKRFDTISVEQTELNMFVVNVKGNMENRVELEKHFTSCAQKHLRINNIKYIFTYDDSKNAKSIFTVKLKDENNSNF